jgi:hypothetical protein
LLSLSLFPDEDHLTKEIESWKGFAEKLLEDDRVTFMKMLNDCYMYSRAINAKGKPVSKRSYNHGPFIFTTQIDRMVGNTTVYGTKVTDTSYILLARCERFTLISRQTPHSLSQ